MIRVFEVGYVSEETFGWLLLLLIASGLEFKARRVT